MNDDVPVINRVAAVVDPKEPYLAWARALDDDEPTIDSLSREQLTSVYLIEELDDDETGERALRRHWPWIFEEKLMAWCRASKDWPRKRTYKMFRQWLDVRLIDLLYDLSDDPLLRG